MYFCLHYLLVALVCFVLATVLFFFICSFFKRIVFHPLPHKHNKQHHCSTSKLVLFLYHLKLYNIAIVCQKAFRGIIMLIKTFVLQIYKNVLHCSPPFTGNQHFLWSKSHWWDESLKCWDQSQNSGSSQRSISWPNKALIFSCKLGDTCFVKNVVWFIQSPAAWPNCGSAA